MSPTNTRFQLRQLTTTLAAASGASDVLRRVADAALRAADAHAAFVERAGDGERAAEVVASTGAPAPAVGAQPPHGLPATLAQWRLAVDDESGRRLGAIVLLGVEPRDEPGAELTALRDLAVTALQVRLLSEDLETRRQELEQAIDERFRLISGITYELRETLGATTEYVQLLDTETELTPRQRDYIESSRRTMAAALRLIGDLLELARVEAGRLPVQHEPIRVGAVLRDVARDYELASATYGVRMVTDVADGLPTVYTDPDLVGQILDTLLSNAVRYSPPNAEIRVGADVQGGRRAGDPRRWLRITITDAGPGVEEADDVFEAVERVSGRRGAPGFRLAISRNVARLLGGDLTLESTPGAGASFSLWLPLPD